MRKVLLLCLLLAPPAPADVIRLKGGGEVEGRILLEEEQHLEVETAFGRQRLARTKVAEIVRAPWTVGLMRDRLAALKPDDLAGLRELRAWLAALPAEEQRKARAERLRLEREVLRLDPEDAPARGFLGFEKAGGRWLKGRELEEWRARQAREEAEAAQGRATAAARAKAEAEEARRLGGATLAVQEAEGAATAAAWAAELAGLAGSPCAAVHTRRIGAKGVLSAELARELCRRGEEFLTATLEALGLPGEEPIFRLGAEGRYHFVAVPLAAMPKAWDALVPRHVPRLPPETRALVLDNRLDLFPNAEGALALHWVGNGDLQESFFHFLGHALASSLAGGFHPWLVEGFAVYTAERNMGFMEKACVTLSRYAEQRGLRRLQRTDLNVLLREAAGRETPLDSLLRKPLNSLTPLDLAKSWSLVAWLLEPPRGGGFRAFLAALAKGRAPAEAMAATLGGPPAAVEERWRAWLARDQGHQDGGEPRRTSQAAR